MFEVFAAVRLNRVEFTGRLMLLMLLLLRLNLIHAAASQCIIAYEYMFTVVVLLRGSVCVSRR